MSMSTTQPALMVDDGLLHQSWLTTWGRRTVSISVYTFVGALWLTTSPAWSLLALLVDVGRRKWRFPLLRFGVFILAYLACEAWGTLAALLLGVVTLGGAVGGQERYLRWHYALQRVWTRALFAAGQRAFSFRVHLDDDVDVDGPVLLLVRHVSSADTVLAAALFANQRRLKLRYVLKQELLWDPCLDIVGKRLPNAFVARRRQQGGPSSSTVDRAAVAQLARDLTPDSGVLIYPEGSRFTPAKQQRALERLQTSGHAQLAAQASTWSHVLPPRLGGTLTLLNTAPQLQVVVLEHAGFDDVGTLADMVNGSLVGRDIYVRFRRVDVDGVAPESRAQWLFDEWAKVDAWVGAHRQAVATKPKV